MPPGEPSQLFGRALMWLLRNEGTEYVHDPRDRGGPTRYGITQASWSAYVGHVATPDEVRAITPADAAHFYHEVYWRPLELDALGELGLERSAMALFDQAVLNGAPRAVRMAQTAAGVRTDGRMGPQTREAICKMGCNRFLLAFVPLTLMRYARICESDQSQVAFLAGWVGRASRLLGLVA